MCQEFRKAGEWGLSHLGFRLSVPTALPCHPVLPLTEEHYPIPTHQGLAQQGEASVQQGQDF